MSKSRNQRVLILVSSDEVFSAFEGVFEEKNCELLRSFESLEDFDLVVTDSRHFQSPAVSFLKGEDGLPIILVVTEEEAVEEILGPNDSLYDIIVVPRDDSEGVRDRVADWLVSPQGMALLKKIEEVSK